MSEERDQWIRARLDAFERVLTDVTEKIPACQSAERVVRTFEARLSHCEELTKRIHDLNLAREKDAKALGAKIRRLAKRVEDLDHYRGLQIQEIHDRGGSRFAAKADADALTDAHRKPSLWVRLNRWWADLKPDGPTGGKGQP